MNFLEVLNQITTNEEIDFVDDLLAGLPATADQDNWLNFAKRTVLAVNYGKYYQANLLLKNLAGLLLGVDDAIRHEYEPILVWLNYAAMDGLADSEVDIFFSQRDFASLFREDMYFNLFDKIKYWLSTKPMGERDSFRERIYNAMRLNDYIFTKFFLAENTRSSVANWLKEYDKAVDFGLANALNRVEFENQSVITAHLNETEKISLKKLLDFYEYIKLSSTCPLGMEDDFVMDFAGNTYLYTNGKEIPANPAATQQKIVDNMPAIIKKTEVAPGAVLPPLSDILKQAQTHLIATNGEIPKVISELQKNLANGNILGSTGSLLLLAQLRRLDDVLSDEPAFRALVAQDLEKSGQAVQREGLNAQPNAPQFLARFLKVILQDNLHINAGEAMAFAGRLGELMALEGEGYRKMVITDERGQAKWNT